MAARHARIVHLAVADGRGHLMRAHLLRRLLANRGIAVDVVTTSEAGRALPRRPGDARHGVARRVRGRVRRPASHARRQDRSPAGGVHRVALAAGARRGDVAAARPGRAAGGQRFAASGGAAAGGAGRPGGARASFTCTATVCGGRPSATSTGGCRRGRAPVTAGCSQRCAPAPSAASNTRWPPPIARASTLAPTRFRLPPLVRPPQRARASVRRALGLAPGERFAAIYLNPHFRDPAIAARLEAALAAAGFRHYGVSEPWAGRPGWRACDAAFSDVVAASDLFVSGAGAAAMEQARLCAVPLLALVGDQPEQALNLATGRAARHGVRRRERHGRRAARRCHRRPRARAAGARRRRGQRRTRSDWPALGRRIRVAGRAGGKGDDMHTPPRRQPWFWRPTTCMAAAPTRSTSR